MSGSTPEPAPVTGRARITHQYAGGTMQKAYDAWLGHSQKCPECRASGKAEDGCATGVDLWRTYRDARISTPGNGSAS